MMHVLERLEKGPDFAMTRTEQSLGEVDMMPPPGVDEHSLKAHFEDIMWNIRLREKSNGTRPVNIVTSGTCP